MNKVREMSILLRALPIVTALLTVGWAARPCQALPAGQLGGQIFATGGDVKVVVQSPAPGVAYTSALLLDPLGAFDWLGVTNFDVGATVDLGTFPRGTE